MALTDKLAAIGAAIREKNGSSQKYTLEQMATAIKALPTGETEWSRPVAWPNLDALPLDGEVIYYTIDNINRDATFRVDTTTSTSGSITADIGYINEDNEFIVADSIALSTNQFTPDWGYFSTIDIDYPIVRLTSSKNILTAVIGAPKIAQGASTSRTYSNVLEVYYSLPNATSMNYLVSYQTQHVKLANLSSACKNMSNAFWFGRDLELVEVENCVTSSVTTYASMFQCCLNIKNTKFLELFDFSNCTTIANMFNGCMGLQEVDLTVMNNTSKITGWNNVFTTCRSILKVNMAGVDTSAATNVTAMFQNMDRVITIDMTGCDFSNVTSYGSFTTSCKVVDFKLPDNLKFGFNLSGAISRKELLLTLDRLPTITEERTITIGSNLLKLLTSEDVAAINAKGWALA